MFQHALCFGVSSFEREEVRRNGSVGEHGGNIELLSGAVEQLERGAHSIRRVIVKILSVECEHGGCVVERPLRHLLSVCLCK